MLRHCQPFTSYSCHLGFPALSWAVRSQAGRLEGDIKPLQCCSQLYPMGGIPPPVGGALQSTENSNCRKVLKLEAFQGQAHYMEMFSFVVLRLCGWFRVIKNVQEVWPLAWISLVPVTWICFIRHRKERKINICQMEKTKTIKEEFFYFFQASYHNK